ncbi:HIT family protein [Nonlabens tegetincola]|uniref:HIT family protein n=1 Tax=Nonlabens tegetincola TaxID=323273 RepID=A0A090PXR2_9FLAO|nr:MULTISPECIES: HIT family protein [Nonlabens]ALM20854.1 HIT family hydrolase [Nonlabens sp. MIC269]PQJ18951.1 HIT family protein [Nonlabens tegetincola]GAK95639.1 HIT family protein [Nonlabens tegetincola]
MSIFSKIITGEIPCHKVAENENFLAFLDINPNAPGHTLCIPKKEVNKLFDLEKQEYDDLMSFSREVALILRQEITCERIGMSVIGLEVPHVHVHLIPIRTMDDMRFSSKVSMSQDEMSELATRLSKRYFNGN